jgi:hypothetical protein
MLAGWVQYPVMWVWLLQGFYVSKHVHSIKGMYVICGNIFKCLNKSFVIKSKFTFKICICTNCLFNWSFLMIHLTSCTDSLCSVSRAWWIYKTFLHASYHKTHIVRKILSAFFTGNTGSYPSLLNCNSKEYVQSLGFVSDLKIHFVIRCALLSHIWQMK